MTSKAASALGVEFVLAGEVGVQRGLGHLGFGNDPVDTDRTDLLGVEQLAGDLDEAFLSARRCGSHLRIQP